MKYKKYEGTLGDFLEECVNGQKFYTLDAGHAYELFSSDINVLKLEYEDGVCIEKEEEWTDHLPVLCWVWDDEFSEEEIAVVTGFSSGWYDVESHGCNYRCARPLSSEEVDKLTWKGGDKC